MMNTEIIQTEIEKSKWNLKKQNMVNSLKILSYIDPLRDNCREIHLYFLRLTFSTNSQVLHAVNKSERNDSKFY